METKIIKQVRKRTDGVRYITLGKKHPELLECEFVIIQPAEIIAKKSMEVQAV
jgi:hypothetical protein